MEIKINSTLHKFFRQRLELLKPLTPYNKLRPRELDLLALFQLFYFNKFPKGIMPNVEQIKDIDKIIFSPETLDEMKRIMNVSDYVFNNNKMALRKKGFLTRKSIEYRYLLDPNRDSQVTFNFQLKIESDGPKTQSIEDTVK